MNLVQTRTQIGPTQNAQSRQPIRAIVGMETSGRTREALRSRGVDAWSCDLLASQDGSPFHIQGDVFDVICQPWDIAVFHPDCTYLTCSAEWAYGDGPYHQKVKPETLVGAARRAARDAAVAGVKRLEKAAAHIPVKFYENPVGVLSSRWKKPSQTFQPYQCGDDASKRTCAWIDGAEAFTIDPAMRFPGRMVEWPRGSGKMVERWSNQTDSGQNRETPGADRWQVRSDTFPGVADWMAENLIAAFLRLTEAQPDLFGAAA